MKYSLAKTHSFSAALSSIFLAGFPGLCQITDPVSGTISPGIEVKLIEVADVGSGARINQVGNAGDGSGRVFFHVMTGPMYVIDGGVASTYLDLSSLQPNFLSQFNIGWGQVGFSTFAFHPDFSSNGKLYVASASTVSGGTPDFYAPTPVDTLNGNAPLSPSHHSVVLELTASDPSANIFSGTVRELLRVEQPYADHNIGQVAFNPNARPGDADYGMLYISFGDGGNFKSSAGEIDPLKNGQDTSNLLGTLIRIDPMGSDSSNGEYGIPDGNPFVGDGDPETLDEIWAYGLRNPHRFSWDTEGDGKMLICDIGQSNVEEINLGLPGANYGWSDREGTWIVDPFDFSAVYAIPGGFEAEGLGYTYPVLQYGRNSWSGSTAANRSVVSGFVYRGTAFPELNGKFIFGDFPVGRLFYADVKDLVAGQVANLDTQVLELIPLSVSGPEIPTTLGDIVGNERANQRFGVDEAGEIYISSKHNGKVYKLVPPTGSTTDYVSWAASNISGPLSLFNEDADKGGLANGLEYLFDVNPADPLDDLLWPQYSIVEVDGQRYNALTFRLDYRAAGASVLVEVSDDLLTWSGGPGRTTLVSSDESNPAYRVVTIRDTQALSSAAQRFIRLNVQLP